MAKAGRKAGGEHFVGVAKLSTVVFVVLLTECDRAPELRIRT